MDNEPFDTYIHTATVPHTCTRTSSWNTLYKARHLKMTELYRMQFQCKRTKCMARHDRNGCKLFFYVWKRNKQTPSENVSVYKCWITCVCVFMRAYFLHFISQLLHLYVYVCAHRALHRALAVCVLKRKDTCSYVFHFSSKNFSNDRLTKTQYVLSYTRTTA